MCDTLCVLGDAGLLFAKNSDRPPDEVQVLRSWDRRRAAQSLATQYLSIPDHDAYALVGSQPTWLWGLEHGVNEHGVVIGNEKVWTTSRPRSRAPALLGMDVVRLGLERAKTADEALTVMAQLIETYGQGGSGEQHHDEPYDSSFLVADRTSAWILETSDRTWAARPTESGAAISNRISLARDWTRSSPDVPTGADFQDWRSPKVPTSIADHRLRTTTGCVRRAPADPQALLATLRDHGPAAAIPAELGADNTGVTVCMHVRGLQATTASMIVAVPRDSQAVIRAWCALGSPCASVYVPFFPAAGIPTELSSAGTWSRFAALRDRAEADAASSEVIQARLAPVERELWAVSAAIADDDRAAQRAYTDTAFAAVEPALADLAV